MPICFSNFNTKQLKLKMTDYDRLSHFSECVDNWTRSDNHKNNRDKFRYLEQKQNNISWLKRFRYDLVFGNWGYFNLIPRRKHYNLNLTQEQMRHLNILHLIVKEMNQEKHVMIIKLKRYIKHYYEYKHIQRRARNSLVYCIFSRDIANLIKTYL